MKVLPLNPPLLVAEMNPLYGPIPPVQVQDTVTELLEALNVAVIDWITNLGIGVLVGVGVSVGVGVRVGVDVGVGVAVGVNVAAGFGRLARLHACAEVTLG
ncbi:MAG: hypothetical protein ACRDIY_23665 [Chloroflexota bacterium]